MSEPPAPPDPPAPPATIGALALQVLHTQATTFLEHEQAARTDDDTEHVHQMRVATRRMRAALRLFGDTLPPAAAELSDELKWITSQLGPVRDLDVQLQRLRDTAADLAITEDMRQYDAWLGDERQRAQTSLEDAIRSERFSNLVERFSELDKWAISTETDAPLLEDAPRRLQRAYKALEKSADPLDADAPAPELHKVRIRAKRLRYAAEFFEPAFDSKVARRLIGHCVAVQDLLGELQDGVVSSHHVHTAVQTSATTWPAETSLALGQFLQFDKQRSARLRKRFPGAYADVKEDWKRLRRGFRP